MNDCVYFAHGKESGPWGAKISALAGVARARGFHVESPDYSSTQDPEERVKMLLALKPCAQGRLVLVGSSMGGYVSAVASALLKVSGIFLLAPAVYIPQRYAHLSPKPNAPLVAVVHGWDDGIIPAANAIRYAQEYNTELHLLNSDHRLMSVLPVVEHLFADFLDRVK